MIGDVDFTVSKLYGMLPADTSGDPTQRTAAQNQTVRTVFVVGPDKRIKLSLAYPMTTGRNFDEVLRAIDSLQLTAHHRVATPANWRYGDYVIIAGPVSDDQARTIWPQGWYAPAPTSASCPYLIRRPGGRPPAPPRARSEPFGASQDGLSGGSWTVRSVAASGWDLTRVPRSACGAPPHESRRHHLEYWCGPQRSRALTSVFVECRTVFRATASDAMSSVERLVG